MWRNFEVGCIQKYFKVLVKKFFLNEKKLLQRYKKKFRNMFVIRRMHTAIFNAKNRDDKFSIFDQAESI